MTDLRLACRQLFKSPGLTVTAVLIIALAIGGNVFVFSLFNGLFLKPLPFPHPEQLVDVDETAPQWNLRNVGINYADFIAWRAHNRTFSALATFRPGSFNVASGRRLERLTAQRVTHDLAAVFGLQPALGRMFTADEEMRHGPRVVVIGHQLWQDWFGGDRTVLGRTLVIDGESYEIIGVLPATAVMPSRAAFWLPFEAPPEQWAGLAIGRLHPGVTIEQASADLLQIHRARIPEQKENAITSPVVQPLLRRHLGDGDRIGYMLQAAVGVLLLIACANVAGLMLARALGRTSEFAIRAALGASRGRLYRQILAESLLLALAGGGAGALLGQWLLDGALGWFLPDLPAWVNVAPDLRVGLFLVATVTVCAALAGLIPAHQILRRLDLRAALSAGGGKASLSTTRISALRGLVIAEIGLALLLMLVASLLGRAFLRVQLVDPGVRPDGVLTYWLQLPEVKYRDDASRVAFINEHLTRLRALPGVARASASTVLPFSGTHAGNFFVPEGGLPGGPDAKPPVILTRKSCSGYFETMGIAIREGRALGENDQWKVVVNETLARLFWPGQSAIGKRLGVSAQGPWVEVVGVAADVRHYGLETEVRPGVYLPFQNQPEAGIGIVVKANGDPTGLAPTIRELVRHQDPTLPTGGLGTLESRIRESLFTRRMYSSLTAAFAITAVVMAMTGLYGIIAYVVGRRRREYGIRVALGAQMRDLVQLVLGEGMRLGAIGIAAGLVAGMLAGFALRSLLAGISPLDPVAMLAATALLGGTVLLACLLPARRAARVDPVETLRSE